MKNFDKNRIKFYLKHRHDTRFLNIYRKYPKNRLFRGMLMLWLNYRKLPTPLLKLAKTSPLTDCNSTCYTLDFKYPISTEKYYYD